MMKYSKQLGDNEKRKLWAVYINKSNHDYYYKTFEQFCSLIVKARNMFKSKL